MTQALDTRQWGSVQSGKISADYIANKPHAYKTKLFVPVSTARTIKQKSLPQTSDTGKQAQFLHGSGHQNEVMKRTRKQIFQPLQNTTSHFGNLLFLYCRRWNIKVVCLGTFTLLWFSNISQSRMTFFGTH